MKKPVHCKTCGSDYHYQSFCPQNRKPLKRSTVAIKTYKRPNKVGKKFVAWQEEREQWFIDNPGPTYLCHYCEVSMEKQWTTLDHEDNRNHKGRILPCCWFDNSRKGSVSHDRYVAKYYPNHKCSATIEA